MPLLCRTEYRDALQVTVEFWILVNIVRNNRCSIVHLSLLLLEDFFILFEFLLRKRKYNEQ